jgi:hypothetical protein
MTPTEPIFIHTQFSHYDYEFEEVDFSRFGSPHFSNKQAGEELSRRFLSRVGEPVVSRAMQFRTEQFEAANEVFPESAAADPIADLEIFDEWQSGTRAFPFPGRYSRLGLTKQDVKISSSTSVGIIGEIFTGLLSQAFISPWVTVRPIRRWPDFVFLRDRTRYARVESKAFMIDESELGEGLARVNSRVLQDGLREAMQDLVSDPSGEVWLFFTEISQINPLSVTVNAIEVNPPPARRAAMGKTSMPPQVVDGLAEQALARVESELESDERSVGPRRMNKPEKRRLAEAATRQLDEVLVENVPEPLMNEAREAVEEEIRRKAKKAVAAVDSGKRLRAAKEYGAEGKLGLLRRGRYSSEALMMADLVRQARAELAQSWRPDWLEATLPWGTLEDLALWRCSSAVVAKGDPKWQGSDVLHATRRR